jgi:hypothetical protein
MTNHISPHWESLLDEFELDWRLSGLVPKTVTEYVRHIRSFLTLFPDPTAMNAKQCLEQTQTAPSRRYMLALFAGLLSGWKARGIEVWIGGVMCHLRWRGYVRKR